MTDTARRPRASIFFFDGWISISASVMGTATELCAHGYEVDIFFTRPVNNLPPPQMPAGIAMHEFTPWTRWITRSLVDKLRRNKLEKLSKADSDDSVRKRSAAMRAMAKAIVGLIEIPQFALYCRTHVMSFDLAIAFDMNSLTAMDFALSRKVPFVYWSLEIWRLADLRDPFSRHMKQHELRRLPQAKAVVAQSAVRRALIEEDLSQPLKNYIEVPNSPAKPMPADMRQDFFSVRFPIQANAWVVLHSGFISTSLMSLEIARTVPSWPPEFTLVFHERQHRDREEPYIRAVQQAGGDRTFMSLDPVPFADIDNIYAGADIGLVCYQTAEANEATAWASSGKLAYYLRHGMPIIVIIPECPPILSEWRCGIWIRDVSEIGAALAHIAEDYDGYSTRARNAYIALFDFSAAFGRLMEFAVNR